MNLIEIRSHSAFKCITTAKIANWKINLKWNLYKNEKIAFHFHDAITADSHWQQFDETNDTCVCCHTAQFTRTRNEIYDKLKIKWDLSTEWIFCNFPEPQAASQNRKVCEVQTVIATMICSELAIQTQKNVYLLKFALKLSDCWAELEMWACKDVEWRSLDVKQRHSKYRTAKCFLIALSHCKPCIRT